MKRTFKYYLKIKEAQQSLSSKIKGSQNWKDTKLNLAKKWEKLVNQFKHYSYQEVNKIIKEYDGISVENLNVRGMLEKKLGDNKGILRRSLLGVKFGMLLKVMTDKVEDTGRSLVPVNPKNTSQTCSNCQELAKVKLTLGDRIFRCWNCELELDRDINSARNILNLGFDRNPLHQKWKIFIKIVVYELRIH